MIRRHVRLFFVVALLAGIGIVLLTSTWWRVAPTNEGELSVSIGNLDLGEIWAQEDFQWPVVFTNHTAREVEVLEVSTSCGCSSAEPSSFRIRANGTAKVKLTLDLRPKTRTQSVRETVPLSIVIWATLKGENATSGRFELRGRVRNPLMFSEPEVFFGGDEDLALLEEQGSRTRFVDFESAVDLVSVATSVEPAYVEAVAVLETERRGVLEVVPKADLAYGPFQCRIEVAARPADGESLPSASLPVRGVVVHDIQAIPPLIAFRPAVVEEYVEATLRLKSRTGEPFSIEGVEVDSKHLSVELLDTTSSEGYVYRVRQHVASTGSHLQRVDFVLAGGRADPERVRLTVSYVGLSNEVQP